MQQQRSIQTNPFFVRLTLIAFLLTPVFFARAQETSLVGERHFRVRLTAPVSSDSTVGSKVAAQVVAPQEFAGNILEGEVVEAHSSNLKDKESNLKFNFNTLYEKEKKTEIKGKVTEAYNSKGVAKKDEQGFTVKADSGVVGAIDDVRKKLPFPRSRTTKETTDTALKVAALLVSYTAKGPKIMFDTGSEFELDVSKR